MTEHAKAIFQASGMRNIFEIQVVVLGILSIRRGMGVVRLSYLSNLETHCSIVMIWTNLVILWMQGSTKGVWAR